MDRIYIYALALLLLASAPVAATAATIHVKVLVDEEEPMVETAWRQRLQSRVDEASEIIRQYCDLQFSVTSFGRWETDDRLQDFAKSLREFEQEVLPAPAQLAIGFSSQYRFQRGRNSLGGTRGPLHSHILIREGSDSIYEPERLEVVLHELGHFLGAAHSGRADSVMRPVLGDGQSRARAFRIGFDPDNARVIRLVAGEVIDRRLRRFSQLTPETKLRLREHYVNLARASAARQSCREIRGLHRSVATGRVVRGPVPRKAPVRVTIPNQVQGPD